MLFDRQEAIALYAALENAMRRRGIRSLKELAKQVYRPLGLKENTAYQYLANLKQNAACAEGEPEGAPLKSRLGENDIRSLIRTLGSEEGLSIPPGMPVHEAIEAFRDFEERYLASSKNVDSQAEPKASPPVEGEARLFPRADATLFAQGVMHGMQRRSAAIAEKTGNTGWAKRFKVSEAAFAAFCCKVTNVEIETKHITALTRLVSAPAVKEEDSIVTLPLMPAQVDAIMRSLEYYSLEHRASDRVGHFQDPSHMLQDMRDFAARELEKPLPAVSTAPVERKRPVSHKIAKSLDLDHWGKQLQDWLHAHNRMPDYLARQLADQEKKLRPAESEGIIKKMLGPKNDQRVIRLLRNLPDSVFMALADITGIALNVPLGTGSSPKR